MALRYGILAVENNKKPIQLQFRKGNRYLAIEYSYGVGLRYLSLERVEGTSDRLTNSLRQ